MTDLWTYSLICLWAITAQLWLNARVRARVAEASLADARQIAQGWERSAMALAEHRDALTEERKHLRLRTRGRGEPLRYDNSNN